MPRTLGNQSMPSGERQPGGGVAAVELRACASRRRRRRRDTRAYWVPPAASASKPLRGTDIKPLLVVIQSWCESSSSTCRIVSRSGPPKRVKRDELAVAPHRQAVGRAEPDDAALVLVDGDDPIAGQAVGHAQMPRAVRADDE